MWKEHFKNLRGKSTRITDEPITKIIKLEQFTPEEFDKVLTKIKNWKDAGLDKIPPEV